MIESEIIENPFQSPCSSADLVNNQNTPYAISFSQHIVQSVVKIRTCQQI